MDEVPILLGDVQRVQAGEAGGVVDQAIEPSHALLDIGEHAGDLGDTLQVGAEQLGAAALFRGADRFLFGPAVVDGHARAFASQPQRDAAAYPFGSAGDQDDFAREALGAHRFYGRRKEG